MFEALNCSYVKSGEQLEYEIFILHSQFRIQNNMTTFVIKDDILALLVHLGYLAFDKGNSEVFIPNEEIGEEFIRAVTGSGWKEVLDSPAKKEFR
jgi:hypothetical protein